MEQYTLVFSGDILPGNDPEETRARLIALLGVAPEKSVITSYSIHYTKLYDVAEPA